MGLAQSSMFWRSAVSFMKRSPPSPSVGSSRKAQGDHLGDHQLCDHLEGWEREGGREGDARGKRYGNICIYITDSLCYKAETNTPL